MTIEMNEEKLIAHEKYAISNTLFNLIFSLNTICAVKNKIVYYRYVME